VKVKTSHGQFEFLNQRFSDKIGQNSFDWLQYTGQCGQSYESERLRSRCCYYANRMSYQEVAKLLKDETGVDLLSSQRIHNIVEEEAERLSIINAASAKATLECGKTLPAINREIPLYDKETEEVLLLNDGIQVKKQKETREKPSADSPKDSLSQVKKAREKVTTDVIVLQRANEGFTYIMEGLDGESSNSEHVSGEELVKSEIIKEYSNSSDALNLVAITDGAQHIRLFFCCVFGETIVIILDWYHLEKKVWELMSMIAWNKVEKEEHCRALLSLLWCGQVDKALEYMTKSISPRNKSKHQELITYLTKHKSEIIDYQRRKEMGKLIGSGRMEKGVDQVIGRRQKDNGMSWSKKGSKALAILKVHELNNNIEEPALLLAA
jgi:hypothetical protein